MTTTADLIAEARRHLESYHRPPMNQLDAAVNSTATTLSFTHDVDQIQAGAYLEIDLELLYVWDVDQTAKTATVLRGQAGSTAAAHAEAAVVVSNPPFPDFAILKALNDDLADLSSPANGLFVMREVDLTFAYGSSGYDLDAPNLLEVHEIRHRIGSASTYRQWPVLTNYEVSRAVNSTDFPSGVALFLAEAGANGQPVRVQYKAGFSPLVNLTDDVEGISGLPSHLHDLPPLGAALRLVAPREIRRNQTDTQGDTRRAEEVPAGAVGASLRGIAGLRQERIAGEAGRLAQQYPDRGFIPQSTGPLLRQRGRW